MKTTAIALIIFVAVVCGAVADETSPPPASTESIIASMPTPSQRKSWEQSSEEQRQLPINAELAQKMKNLSANCELLHSRIIVGKPLSDYPGLLALGWIRWDNSARTYHLQVVCHQYKQKYMYKGFDCTIDQSFNIVRVAPVFYMN